MIKIIIPLQVKNTAYNMSCGLNYSKFGSTGKINHPNIHNIKHHRIMGYPLERKHTKNVSPC